MARPVVTIGLVVLVTLAGCGDLVSDRESNVPSETEPTVAGADYRVTVTSVIDGDTIRIRFSNGTTDTVRLLGVDTPETRGENDPGEFEGVPDTEAGRTCLREAGHDATRFATRRLLGKTVALRLDSVSDTRGYYDRLLAYVVHDGQNINYRLVVDGYARVYDSQFSKSARFYTAERRAQQNRTGIWACR